jgi:hypothetical protein
VTNTSLTSGGIIVGFSLGVDTNLQTATPNAWGTSNAYGTSSTVDVAATTGATFYVTGVQLEQNYQPTPFEQRPIGTELALCQRYYERWDGNVSFGQPLGTCAYYTATNVYTHIMFKVSKRIAPTTIYVSGATHGIVYSANAGRTSTAWGFDQGSTMAVSTYMTTSTATQGNAGIMYVDTGSGRYFAVDVEL